MGKLAAILSVGIVVCVSKAAPGTTRYVDGCVTESGDGTSLGTAFNSIQEGIDAACDGDTVIVAQGTYVENIQFHGKNIVLTSTDPLDPAVVGNTIIDGSQCGSVATFSGTEQEACILSGFTIRRGSAVEGGGVRGGTWGSRTRATIRNNVIITNTAEGEDASGGGVAYCDGKIQNNNLSRNSAAFLGGGLHGCDGLIENNIVSGNSAMYGGGMVSCYGTIQNNTIVGNSTTGGGGGIGGCGGSIRNCIIWGNSARGPGKQVHESGNPVFCCIQDWAGGGIGNTSLDPRFLAAGEGDYRLDAGSPCVDAGINYYWFGWPQRDLEGNCRLGGERIDIGCYECGTSRDADGDLLADPSEAAAGTNAAAEDTDGDGLRDGIEVLRGTDPLGPTIPGGIRVPSEASTVQASLALAMDREEIVVGPGTYRENLQFCGSNVVLRGTDPKDPGVVASTTLDGGGLAPVVSLTGGEGEVCVLSGFTICNGTAYRASGICGHGTHATIRGNVIRANRGPSCGAGLDYCHGLIEGNTITGNFADHGAGLWRCHGTIQNNRITENTAAAGSALYQCHGTIKSNLIAGNSGGGILWCNGIICNNVIRANRAEGVGGGIGYCEGTIHDNIICGNSAGTWGGGLIYCNGTIRNNTIVGNSAQLGGGLMWCSIADNCIIWDNLAPEGPQLYECPDPLYSCVQDWTAGAEGNVSLDPSFADPGGADDDSQTYEDNDYRLTSNSPCIDAGDNWVVAPGELDVDGNLRVAFGRFSLTVDMGAYEFNSSRLRITHMVPADEGRVLLTWTSQPRANYTLWSCKGLLNGPWTQERASPIPSQGASTSCFVLPPPEHGRFYRVEMAP